MMYDGYFRDDNTRGIELVATLARDKDQNQGKPYWRKQRGDRFVKYIPGRVGQNCLTCATSEALEVNKRN